MVVGRFRVPLPKEYLAAAVDYVRFHSLMLDFKAQLCSSRVPSGRLSEFPGGDGEEAFFCVRFLNIT